MSKNHAIFKRSPKLEFTTNFKVFLYGLVEKRWGYKTVISDLQSFVFSSFFYSKLIGINLAKFVTNSSTNALVVTIRSPPLPFCICTSKQYVFQRLTFTGPLTGRSVSCRRNGRSTGSSLCDATVPPLPSPRYYAEYSAPVCSCRGRWRSAQWRIWLLPRYPSLPQLTYWIAILCYLLTIYLSILTIYTDYLSILTIY